MEFDTLVLDEAQHIKNRQTQNALAVKAVRAGHRLVLTGTPMENSVLDLWSIIDFLMPGYLGSAADFRERYEQPITRDKDDAVQARLGRRLRPLILRRLKTQYTVTNSMSGAQQYYRLQISFRNHDVANQWGLRRV